MSKPTIRLAAFIAMSAAAWGQPWAVEQARITGGDSDNGKCSLEIEIDAAAEVEIDGAQGRMRSLGGSEPVWKRLECSSTLPPSARDFRFHLAEGRGKVYVVRQPRENRGVAVIRIEDSRNGRSKYAFELEWTGSGGLISSRGFGDGGYQNGGLISAPAGPAPDGWNQEIRFQSKGDGYYRTFNATDALLESGTVNIETNGRVHVEFKTKQRYTLGMSGRLVHADRNRLVASVNGSGIDGTMELSLDRRNRVLEITMSGEGRNRFELRWRAK